MNTQNKNIQNTKHKMCGGSGCVQGRMCTKPVICSSCTRNTKHKIQNTKCETQNMKHKMHTKHKRCGRSGRGQGRMCTTPVICSSCTRNPKYERQNTKLNLIRLLLRVQRQNTTFYQPQYHHYSDFT